MTSINFPHFKCKKKEDAKKEKKTSFDQHQMWMCVTPYMHLNVNVSIMCVHLKDLPLGLDLNTEKLFLFFLFCKHKSFLTITISLFPFPVCGQFWLFSYGYWTCVGNNFPFLFFFCCCCPFSEIQSLNTVIDVIKTKNMDWISKWFLCLYGIH